jgi:hypothetical protein
MILQNREPNEQECFAALANAMIRLNGKCDQTASAIQTQMREVNFEIAARAINVPLADLIDTFKGEMLKRGFFIAQQDRGRPQ